MSNLLVKSVTELPKIKGAASTPVTFEPNINNNVMYDVQFNNVIELTPNKNDIHKMFANAARPQMSPEQAMHELLHATANDKTLKYSQRTQARELLRQQKTLNRLGMGRLTRRFGLMEKGSKFLASLPQGVLNKFDAEGKIRLALGIHNPELHKSRSHQFKHGRQLSADLKMLNCQLSQRRHGYVSDLKYGLPEEPKPNIGSRFRDAGKNMVYNIVSTTFNEAAPALNLVSAALQAFDGPYRRASNAPSYGGRSRRLMTPGIAA